MKSAGRAKEKIRYSNSTAVRYFVRLWCGFRLFSFLVAAAASVVAMKKIEDNRERQERLLLSLPYTLHFFSFIFSFIRSFFTCEFLSSLYSGENSRFTLNVCAFCSSIRTWRLLSFATFFISFFRLTLYFEISFFGLYCYFALFL